jgi:protoporphyrinogen/coproporphyrinogen III oxidase
VGYTEKVVVVGAGVSGLACAYRLKQLGLRPLVLEAADRAGGVIATVRRNGFLFETGPQFPRFPSVVWRLVHELGLQDEFLAGDPKAKRYIFHEGHLHPAPFSPGGLIKTRLVGLRSKLRVLAEPFGSSQPPEREESLSEFVERKFGPDILENLVDPFISTIFFGDAQKMGMQSAFPALVEWERQKGSLVRGALAARKAKRNGTGATKPSQRETDGAHSGPKKESLHVTDALPTLGSFREGMASLMERLAEGLRDEIRYKAQITSLWHGQDKTANQDEAWQIGLADGERIIAEHLVLAVPAYAAGKLLAASAAEIASQLNAIEYAPVCAVSSAYKKTQVQNALDGFGFMVPRREGLNTICTFWNSSIFGNRAPEGSAVMTSFSGREENSQFWKMSEAECARTVETENARILGITGEPLDRVVWRDARALPQYNVGHARRVSEIDDILRNLPGLHLAGNFLKGRSIGDCVEIGSIVAEKIHSHLQA